MTAFGHPDRDWPGNNVGKAGNYICRCFDCGKEFIAHKRRNICRACAAIREAHVDAAP